MVTAKMSSPFASFVSEIYENRLEAKRSGNDAMSFVYKILMNSLYGRFGISPECTTTEICAEDRYKHLTLTRDIIHADKISEKYYIVMYKINTERDNDWSPPLSRLFNWLQQSQHVLGFICIHSFQEKIVTILILTLWCLVVHSAWMISLLVNMASLNSKIREGIFLAPKSYYMLTSDGKEILRHKGAAKALVNKEWYQHQYDHPTSTQQISVTSHFNIKWRELNITKTKSLHNLGIQIANKRKPV
jgi:hypothetical protein